MSIEERLEITLSMLIQLKDDVKEFKHLDIIDEIEDIIAILEDNYI